MEETDQAVEFPLDAWMDWARAQIATPPALHIGGQELAMIAAYSAPDMYEDHHADPDELQPYFIDASRSQAEAVHEMPADADYVQLFFNVPLDAEARAAKQEEKNRLGDGGPVVADLAVELSEDGVQISAWNGLHETFERANDRGEEALAEVEFADVSAALNQQLAEGTLQPDQLLETLSDALGKDALMQRVFPDIVAEQSRTPKMLVQDSVKTDGMTKGTPGQIGLE